MCFCSFTCRRMTTNMEGVLLKWTNYLSGWQPRWFVLDNGVLSYYKSQEDVNNGCKGSIKMAVCDIVVHPTDMTRLDLIIPGEQHYYVKAGTPQDRQSWLIALGSSKASFSEASAAKKDADAMPDLMRTKKSELRLYCDLLMQQVHSIKQTVSASDKLDVEKLTESTSLIVVTCDTFIATLDECMKLVSSTPMFESPHQHVRDAAIPASPTRANVQRLPGTRSVITRPVEKSSKHRTSSVSSTDSLKINPHQSLVGSSSPRPSPSPTSHPHSLSYPITTHPLTTTPTSNLSPVGSTLSPTSPPPSSPSQSPSTNPLFAPKSSVNGLRVDVSDSNSSSLKTAREQISLPQVASSAASSEDLENFEDFKDAIDENIMTFFSAMPTSFINVDTSQEDHILVIPFLEACRNLVPIFDKLNSAAFAPVKMDFSGNIKKIQQKYDSNPENFTTLQSMVMSELENNQHTNSNSATSALLWLKRSLEFIREFLRECNSGSTDMSVCAGNAYARTLKLYHGWVVRGVFAVAVKALPYKETFMSHLAAGDPANIDTATQQFEHTLLADIETFVFHLNRVLIALSNFYIRHSLDSTDTV